MSCVSGIQELSDFESERLINQSEGRISQHQNDDNFQLICELIDEGNESTLSHFGQT